MMYILFGRLSSGKGHQLLRSAIILEDQSYDAYHFESGARTETIAMLGFHYSASVPDGPGSGREVRNRGL